MRRKNTAQLLAALLAALTLLVSGCGEKQEASDGAPDEPLMREEDLTVEPLVAVGSSDARDADGAVRRRRLACAESILWE